MVPLQYVPMGRNGHSRWRTVADNWCRRKTFLSRMPSKPSCGCREASTKSNSKNMNTTTTRTKQRLATITSGLRTSA